MQRALTTLTALRNSGIELLAVSDSIEALRSELAKPEPEPVAWLMENRDYPPIGRMLNFKPVEGWHIAWTNVPLYRKEDV